MQLDQDEDGCPRIKVILVGETGVGKTNLINVTMEKDFNDNERSSIAASFSMKKMKVDEKIYNLYLWDTMGQEKMKALTKIFFKNAKIVILVYDITKKKTFLELENWLKDIKELLGNNIVIGICGNKSDLFMEEEVSEEDVQGFADKIKSKYALTSAKSDKYGFCKFLNDLLEEFINIYVKNPDIDKKKNKEEKKEIEPNDQQSIILKKPKKEKKKKKSKC